MNTRTFLLAFGLLALSSLGWAITLTGKANIDFNPANLIGREAFSTFKFNRTSQVTCGDWMAGTSKASNPWKTIQPEVRRSGMDMDAVHMMYDDINDRLYVGIECGAICGDIDGDGNPSGTDPNAANRVYNGTRVNLGTDIAGMCESELFSWMLWNSPPSNYDPTKTNRFYPNIIVGLRLQDCLVNEAGNTELRAYEFTKGSCQPNFNTTSQSPACSNVDTLTAQTNVGFGPTITSQYGLPPLVIEKQSLYLNATHPHVEFYLPNWSQYPTFNTWDTPALLPFEPAKETKAGQAPFRLAFKAKSAAVDDCGEDTVSPQLWTIKWDCAGWPNGNAVYDVCGDCAGPGLRCRDCNGTVNGTLVLDNYGVCGGNNTADCSGNPNGTLKYDRCNVCDGHDECVDCFDVPFGTAVVDKYGVCGGNNYADCEGNPFGSKVYDDCGICGGDNTSCSCQHYLGYDLADVDYALLRWTVQASLIKINDTLEVLEAIRAKLAASEYKSGSAASFVDYIDILHDFCDDCLDSFDSAQIWFASYLSEACDGIQCAPTPLSGTEWTL